MAIPPEDDLLAHIRGQQDAQYKGAMVMLRWLVTCVDQVLAEKMRKELKRDVLIPLETRFATKRLVKPDTRVVESPMAEAVQS